MPARGGTLLHRGVPLLLFLTEEFSSFIGGGVWEFRVLAVWSFGVLRLRVLYGYFRLVFRVL